MELVFERIADEIIPSQTERVAGEVTVRLTPATDGYFGIAHTVIPIEAGVGILHTDVIPDGVFVPRFLLDNRCFAVDPVEVKNGGIEPLPVSREDVYNLRRALADQTKTQLALDARIRSLERAVGESVVF